jgi:small subunit ribosomal protein S13
MAIRIVGVDLPQNKRGEVGLTYIYGIGRNSAKKILETAGVNIDIKVKDWTDDQAVRILVFRFKRVGGRGRQIPLAVNVET